MGTVNDRMRELRSNSDITLKAMSEIIGVSEATVQRYESGKISKVPYKAIIEYANKFHVTPSYIMGWTDDPTEAIEKRIHTYPTAPYDILYPLSDDEVIVIESYRKLNESQKDMIKKLVDLHPKTEETHDKDIQDP